MDKFFFCMGLTSALCFGFCTLPQILRVKKRKSTADISLLFVLLSLLGNLTSASYILYTNIQQGFWQIPQYFNYAIATTLVVTLLTYKLKYDGAQIKESLKKSIWNARCKIEYWWYYQSAGTFVGICSAALLAILAYSIISLVIELLH